MFKQLTVSLTLIAALAGGVTLLAPTAARADQPSEQDALVHVHDILTLADHDYEGHRVKAKHAVDDACAAMHIEIRGDHHNFPGQRSSDELMREADRELQDVRRVAAERHQGEVMSHVDEAIHEIHMALHIR